MMQKIAAKPSNTLIIGGQRFHIDWRTYNFQDEDPGFNAYLETCSKHSNGQCGPGGAPYQPAAGLEGKTKRYRARHTKDKPSYNVARTYIKQFVVHLDGCEDAEMCFNVLHNERGLSCHFILGNDGTLFQTLDLIDCAYHAQGMNETSIGIEICNRGNAAKDPTYYQLRGTDRERPPVVCTINGDKYVAFDFTPAQKEGMVALGKTLARLLPGIKLNYPQAAGGEQRWDTLMRDDPTNVRLRDSFSGYLGHYHVTDQKWDPGPFDFRKFIRQLSGSRFYPIPIKRLGDKAPPVIPDDKVQAESGFVELYQNNELHPTGGGFFPVGPLEKPRLWHDGIHLYAEPNSKVYSPFPGTVVAARNGPVGGEIGSTNYVLLGHSLGLGGAETLNFFSLYYHLAEEKGGGHKDDLPKWMSNPTWRDTEHRNTVVLAQGSPPVGEPVQAGEFIGRIGVAGNDPPEGQLHWEIFATSMKVVDKVDRNREWTKVVGRDDQRFCGNPEIMKMLDIKPHDGVVSINELLEAYQSNDAYRQAARRMVAEHYSEFSDTPDWAGALAASPEFQNNRGEAQRLFEKQILPGLWLNADVATRLRLPGDRVLFFFHPITFVRWANNILRSSEAVAAVRAARTDDYATASKGGMVDFDDTKGVAALSKEDTQGQNRTQPELRELLDGYGD